MNDGWTWNGSVDAPTFAPSILVRWRGYDEDKPVETCCHSFVREGMIQFLTDCTHRLAGQTVPLAPWPFSSPTSTA